jgi:hypothetical protein
MLEPLMQPDAAPVRSFAVAIMLLDHSVRPVGCTLDGLVPIFWFPQREASAVLARYGQLKQDLTRLVEATRAAGVQR